MEMAAAEEEEEGEEVVYFLSHPSHLGRRRCQKSVACRFV